LTFTEFYNAILSKDIKSSAGLPYPITKLHFKKGEIITKYGQTETAVYFLSSGMVEMTLKSYMTEKIIDFFFENEMFTSLTSFLTRQPSDVQMKALMDCDAEKILYEDLMNAYCKSLDANKLGRILIEQAYIKKANREKDFLSKTAEEKYAELLRNQPKYISHIPVNKIARYLGVHPESLSRIRRKINS
jgi:CRP-like cAMP-binding protein